MDSITVYKTTQKLDAIMTTANVQGVNIPITGTDFKIYRGVDNPLSFVIRDQNRRPIDLTDKTVTMIVTDINTGRSLLVKDATITDATCGKVSITLTAADVAEWELGYQRYSLVLNYNDGSSPLYLDLNYNVTGFFELLDGAVPSAQDSIIVNENDWTPMSTVPGGPTKYISCAFPGDAYYGASDGLHTVAVYVNNFSGKFYVQGSLVDSTTPNNTDWFDVWLTNSHPEIDFDESTGIEPYNFTGSIRWIRFVYIPDATNEGSVTKVAYRN